MLKRIILSAISILILVQICTAQSGNSAKGNTNREAVRRKRRIEQLINERDQIKKFLAEYERIWNLPDIEKTREEYEKKLILQALAETNWVKTKAAKLLNINRTTLIEKMKKKNLYKPAVGS